jgi:hypothetical protein
MPWPAAAGMAPIVPLSTPTLVSNSGQMKARGTANVPSAYAPGTAEVPAGHAPGTAEVPTGYAVGTAHVASAPSTADMPGAVGLPDELARARRQQGFLATALVVLLAVVGSAAWRAHRDALIPKASLALMSEPAGAKVELDHHRTNTTPWDVRNLPVGEHTLDFTADDRLPVPLHVRVMPPRNEGDAPTVEIVGEKPAEVTFEPSAGFATLNVKMRRQQGTVKLTTKPGTVEVLVDHISKGSFNSGDMVAIDTGKHEVELRANGYKALDKSVDIQWSKELDINASLTPINGTLVVNSSPRGASVSLNGVIQNGHTPLLLTVPAQHYTVVVHKNGFRDISSTATVQPNKKSVVDVSLKKAPVTVTVVTSPIPSAPPPSAPVPSDTPAAPASDNPPPVTVDQTVQLPPPNHPLTAEQERKRQMFIINTIGALADVRQHPDHRDAWLAEWAQRMENEHKRGIPQRVQALRMVLDRVVDMKPAEFAANQPNIIRTMWRIRVQGIDKQAAD